MRDKTKIYIFSIIGVLILAIVIFLVIPLLVSKIKSASVSLAQQKEAFNNLEVKQRNFYEFNREYQQIKPDLGKIESAFIEEEKILDFIVALENIAKQSGNKYEIKVIERLAGGTEQGGAKSINFQISLKGSYPSLVRFLVSLEGMPYMNKVATLQIQRISLDKQEFEAGNISSNIIINAYLKND